MVHKVNFPYWIDCYVYVLQCTLVNFLILICAWKITFSYFWIRSFSLWTCNLTVRTYYFYWKVYFRTLTFYESTWLLHVSHWRNTDEIIITKFFVYSLENFIFVWYFFTDSEYQWLRIVWIIINFFHITQIYVWIR